MCTYGNKKIKCQQLKQYHTTTTLNACFHFRQPPYLCNYVIQCTSYWRLDLSIIMHKHRYGELLLLEYTLIFLKCKVKEHVFKDLISLSKIPIPNNNAFQGLLPHALHGLINMILVSNQLKYNHGLQIVSGFLCQMNKRYTYVR